MTLRNFLPRREEFVGFASEDWKHGLPVQPNTRVHSCSMSSFTKIAVNAAGMMLREHLYKSVSFPRVRKRNAEELFIDVYLVGEMGEEN